MENNKGPSIQSQVILKDKNKQVSRTNRCDFVKIFPHFIFYEKKSKMYKLLLFANQNQWFYQTKNCENSNFK